MALLDAPTTALDVVLVRWPSQRAERERLVGEGVPRLLLVEAGHAPPDDGHDHEDWIRTPADPVDLHHRLAALRRHVRVPSLHLDDSGLLWREDRWVALGEIELALVRTLLDHAGRLVRREALHAVAWPEGGVDDRALDRGIARVRPKLADLGVHVHCITATGYLLEVDADGAPTR